MLLAHPPYSPDMASCDFFLFPELKKMLAAIVYNDEEDLFSASSSCQRMAFTTPLKTGSRGVMNALFNREDMWKKITKPCLSRLMYKEVIKKYTLGET